MTDEIRVELPPLHPGQQEVAASPARFRVLAKGRRWGGTRLGVALVTKTALEGGMAFWVAPSFPVAAIGWRTLRFLAQRIPGCKIREAEKRIEYVGGGVAQVKSADSPESLLGEGLDLVVVDEAATIKKLKEVWEVSLRPALTDRKGKAVFISSPRGRNYFYKLWKDAQELDDWESWRFPTSSNPYIDPAELEEAKRLLPALVYAQEHEAMFTEQQGAMFRAEWFNIISEAPEGRYYRFWDLAASPEGDYTVGEKGALIDGELVIADVVRGRWELPQLLRTITETALEDGPDVVVGIEQVQFQLAAIQALRAEPKLSMHIVKGIPVRVPSTSVRALYENLPRDKRAKAARSASWLVRAESGKVSLVEGQWNKGWLDRVCDFPLSGSYDDEIDATSGLMQMVGRQRTISFGFV